MMTGLTLIPGQGGVETFPHNTLTIERIGTIENIEIEVSNWNTCA